MRELDNDASTYAGDQVESLGTDDGRFARGEVGELIGALEDGVGERRVGLAAERSFAEEELVRDHAERPPIDRGEVTTLRQHFRSHVSHRSGHARQRPALGEVHGDVEVGQMRVPLLVEQDVVWFEIAVDVSRAARGDVPMDDAFAMEIVETEREFGHVEFDDVLGHLTLSIEVEPEIAAEHEIEDHEEVLIVLKRVSQIADERRIDLLEQSALLQDVADRVLLDTACVRQSTWSPSRTLLVDILEGEELLGLANERSDERTDGPACAESL